MSWVLLDDLNGMDGLVALLNVPEALFFPVAWPTSSLESFGFETVICALDDNFFDAFEELCLSLACYSLGSVTEKAVGCVARVSFTPVLDNVLDLSSGLLTAAGPESLDRE